MIHRRWLLVVLGWLLAAPLSAQSGLSWRLQVYNVGANPVSGSPFYVLMLPTATVRCAKTQTLPTVPDLPLVNPRTLWWTQPELPGYVCKADLSRQTTFLRLPAGGPYPFSLVTVNASGSAPPTAGKDPFITGSLPLAVGVLIIRH
jgi:hypothetical protein